MSNTSILDQMNLTPQERRGVVIAGVILFVVLNMLLVWPHFSDLGKVRAQLEQTRQTIEKWKKQIRLDVAANGYRKELADLEHQQGGAIQNQQIQLQRTIGSQAARTGVNISNYQPINTDRSNTNAFFEEQSEKITFESQEPQLITFLYNIGNDPSMIRVRMLNLKPADANRYRLHGDVTLTANYAKNPATAAAKAAVKGARPVPTAPGQRNVPGGPPGSRPFPNPRIPPGAQPVRKTL